MTIENPTLSPNEPKKSWEEIAAEASATKADQESAALEALVAEAAATGKEEFDADKLLQFYYPNDLTDDLDLIRKRAELYRSDYYHSGAMTLEDWAKNREQIEAQGDS